MTENIILIDYKKIWEVEFLNEKIKWELILGESLKGIHHIGSTAIQSMKAKPIIDILIEVDSIDKLDNLEQNILSKNYVSKGEYGIEGRRFYQKIILGKRKFHIHCFEYNHPQVSIHIEFRDKLIRDENLAKEYEVLKINLANQFAKNREAYSEGKSEFILNVLQK